MPKFHKINKQMKTKKERTIHYSKVFTLQKVALPVRMLFFVFISRLDHTIQVEKILSQTI